MAISTGTATDGTPSSTTKSTPTSVNHTSGGAPLKEHSVNATTPASEPQQVVAVGVEPGQLGEAGSR